jgi:hypothetical protein
MSEYPKDTIGYHRENAAAVLGEGSPAVAWLDRMAARDEQGHSGKVFMREPVVIQLLYKLHTGESTDE